MSPRCAIYHPSAMPQRRNVVEDQQLVRDLWQKVQARIDSSGALRAFLTQKIDDCGQTVAYDAFDLVRQVLNPDGFVRRAHKSADECLGAAITQSESPWAVAGSNVDRQWDFTGTWHKNRKEWPKLGDYRKLDENIVNYFCDVSSAPPSGHDRDKHAVYVKNASDLDLQYSMPAIGITIPPPGKSPSENQLEILRTVNKFPDDYHIIEADKCVRRWETFYAKYPQEAFDSAIAPGGKWKCSDQYASLNNTKKGIDVELKELCRKNELEPYWRFAWRADDWAKWQCGKETAYMQQHKMCNLMERPDLILEIGYLCADSGQIIKRVVICEIDGENKTKNKDQPNEDISTKIRRQDDPIKLALKLMSSTSAQLALQPETYHIRANYVWYDVAQIERSLTSTTAFELPEFDALIRTYTDRLSADYETIHHAIHFMHHMFTAHVKIAFLIHMLTVYGIDVRSSDEQDKRMRNNCFFVNFQASYIPEELSFEHRMPQEAKAWLQSKKMLHTRVLVKTYNTTERKAEWKQAPVMSASSDRSAMKTWCARITRANMPNFPFETRSVVQVVNAVIQRVDMKELIKLVSKAAADALNAYEQSRELKMRSTKIKYGGVEFQNDMKRRAFADRCFLTRKQQHDKTRWYNQTTCKLRSRAHTEEDDQLELTWGYEDPTVKRKFQDVFDDSNLDHARVWKHWDQVDVRMHFFNIEMNKVKEKWTEAANGVWYLQDYCDFFTMLRKLPEPAAYLDKDLTLLYNPAYLRVAVDQAAFESSQIALSHYAFKTTPGVNAALMHQSYVTQQQVDRRMPLLTQKQEHAYHRFSVLSWFFDCRDSGACRSQWEDYVLTYFGADETKPSGLDDFVFANRKDAKSITTYFDNPWFIMTVFLEINFRNAVTPMHYKLWQTDAQKKIIPGQYAQSLQAKAKELFNRQHSLLNTRARFAGLQGVSPGLSWQKNTQRNCLRNLLLSSLDDTLPELDPFLVKYLEKFNAPNAALFLRMIEVSNVLALRELALQHKLASQASPAQSKPASKASPAMSKLEQRLSWFEPAIQSEIRHLMHSVERDDSVFVAAPVVHPTKAIVLEEELMRKWVRQTLGVHQNLHTLRCPLDIKFHMFTSQEMFRVFMELFCSKTQLDNTHTQRPVVFVLLQIYLAMRVMQGTLCEDGAEDKAINMVQRTNPVWCATRDIDHEQQCHASYSIDVRTSDQSIVCTPGSSLETWPLRDQNLWCKPSRDDEKKAKYTALNSACKDLLVDNLKFSVQEDKTKELELEFEAEDEQRRSGLEDEEMRRWLLLTCARPVPCEYVIQDNGTYQAGEKQHEFQVDDCVVRQQPERRHSSITGRQRDTLIATVSDYQVSVEKKLEVHLCNDPCAHMFFEKIDEGSFDSGTEKEFPQYIQELVTEIPDRTLIYVPSEFSRLLWTEDVHESVFIHNRSFWKMVCVGYRAWAWKRLLVKSIFFDALAKIVTRSSVLLSLFEHPTTEKSKQEDQNNKYRQMLADTQDAFGTLAIRKDRLHNNLYDKKTQTILAVSRKKQRRVSINKNELTIDEIVKVHAVQRQVEWYRLFKIKYPEAASCRFMLLEPRLSHEAITTITPYVVKDNEGWIYRSYLYTIKPLEDMFVRYRGHTYIKFPASYSVLGVKDTSGKNIKTIAGFVKAAHNDIFFATCWDCRRYSYLRSRLFCKPDSKQTMEILQMYCAPDAAARQISTSKLKWPSTQSSDLQVCKYMHTDPSAVIDANVTAAIKHIIRGINEQQQKRMYTLPDVFQDADFNPGVLTKTKTDDSWNDLLFLKSLSQHGANAVLFWNKLRSSSRYVGVDIVKKKVNFVDVDVADTVISTGDENFSEPFKDIIHSIRARIRAKPNEDTI
jgi:hypothetical protein